MKLESIFSILLMLWITSITGVFTIETKETNSKPTGRPASKLNQRRRSILFILFICNLI
ncbi:hypothetical protein V6Z11_A10G229700 [Gossypium hirsutum]